MSAQKFVNEPAANVPYFTPAQIPASGAALDPQPDGKPIPKLFQPIKVRGVEFQNRIWVGLEQNNAGCEAHDNIVYLAIATLPILREERHCNTLALGTS